MSENFRSNVCGKYALQGSFRAVCMVLFLYSFEYVSLFKLLGKRKIQKKSLLQTLRLSVIAGLHARAWAEPHS